MMVDGGEDHREGEDGSERRRVMEEEVEQEGVYEIRERQDKTNGYKLIRNVLRFVPLSVL